MKPELQRIAIAEACGTQHLSMASCGLNQYVDIRPDYLGDLNACHEFEKTLTNEEARIYHDFLRDRETPSVADCIGGSSPWAERWTYHATATQRCAAFLSVIQLREDPACSVCSDTKELSDNEQTRECDNCQHP